MPTRSQSYASIPTRALVTAGTVSVKCRARLSAKSSIWPTPYCLANANTVFFWLSVGSTWDWSPEVCASAKSPRSVVVTDRSWIS